MCIWIIIINVCKALKAPYIWPIIHSHHVHTGGSKLHAQPQTEVWQPVSAKQPLWPSLNIHSQLHDSSIYENCSKNAAHLNITPSLTVSTACSNFNDQKKFSPFIFDPLQVFKAAEQINSNVGFVESSAITLIPLPGEWRQHSPSGVGAVFSHPGVQGAQQITQWRVRLHPHGNATVMFFFFFFFAGLELLHWSAQL